jgi:ABC-type multidrug transport system ATPase subunit
MELVAQPSLLLLDEPTSGLDASTSIDVIRALREVAQSGGVNVIVVLHQPRVEILRLFDDLLLLAPGGRTVYAGSTASAVAYFEDLGYERAEECNPADFFLDVICGRLQRNGDHPQAPGGDHTGFLVDRWDVSQLVKELEDQAESVNLSVELAHERGELPSEQRQMASFVTQTWLCTKRAIVQHSRELNTAFANYFLMATVGVVLGLLFHAVELTKVPYHAT